MGSDRKPCRSKVCGSSDAMISYGDWDYCFSCKRSFPNKKKASLFAKHTIESKHELDDVLLDPEAVYEIGQDIFDKAGMDSFDIAMYNIGYSPSNRRIIIPAYTYDNKYLGHQRRTIEKSNKFKYWQPSGEKPPLFFSRLKMYVPGIINIDVVDLDFVVIVEDAFSAIRLGKYVPTIAILGTQLDGEGKQIEMLSSFYNRFFIWLDDDKAGRKASLGLEKRLSNIGQVLGTIYCREPKLCSDTALILAAKSMKATSTLNP